MLLTPTFCNNVIELSRLHNPAILILTETKASGDRAEKIVDRLPFDGAIFTNSIGLSGGLWLLCDSSRVSVAELSKTEQEIHALVTPNYSNTPWLLSAIYASPRLAERRLLWDNLKTLSDLHSFPLVMVGDFNEVLMGEDKFGGRAVNISRALRFQECLNFCRMIDIGFSRTRFTWSNQRPLTHLIQERIDRVFVNAEWNDLFPEVSIQHLERAHSDHCPVLLCLNRSQDVKLPWPFQFQPMWLNHPDFLEVVREAWASPTRLIMAVSTFADKARIRNKNIFGNLFHRKKRVLARLGGIQKAMSINLNNFLVDLERDLRTEFHEIAKL